MSSFTILIKSSSGGCYNVAFDIATFKARCDCSAGMFGDFCKHLKTFFGADQSLLFQEDQLGDFSRICGGVLKAAFVKSLKLDK
jgi:hypothetical protein